jgi:[protein-PII] uridylyltransferase
VQSVEALQMLYLLSAADMAAVGPEGLSEWRLGLLTQLYQRTESQFRDEKPDQRFQKELDALRDQVRQRSGNLAQESWWTQQIDAIPVNYLLRCPPEQLTEELARIQSLNEQQPALAWAKYNADSGTVEYTVAMQEPSTPIGIFHRITGALSSQGLQILTAEVHTQPGQIAWDRFEVEDLDFEGRPPESRMNAVCQTIVQSLDPSHPHPPAFRTVWRKESKQKSQLVRSQPTLVQFDNNSSERFTIISVFAYDRLGLLYAIAKVLFDQGLDLQVAKISTHLDQVVDVFYVTDFEGRKIEEPTRLYMLRQKLLAASEPS